MAVRFVGVIIVFFSLALAGCSNNPSAKPATEAGQKTAKAPADSGGKKSMGTEAEACAVLKAALDSWAFGDTLEKFEKDHPGVSFFDTNWITKKRLGRYEIGNVRKDGITFEFLVTLTFREDAGDVTKSGDYLSPKMPMAGSSRPVPDGRTSTFTRVSHSRPTLLDEKTKEVLITYFQGFGSKNRREGNFFHARPTRILESLSWSYHECRLWSCSASGSGSPLEHLSFDAGAS